jgi:hypothetical protein
MHRFETFKALGRTLGPKTVVMNTSAPTPSALAWYQIGQRPIFALSCCAALNRSAGGTDLNRSVAASYLRSFACVVPFVCSKVGGTVCVVPP